MLDHPPLLAKRASRRIWIEERRHRKSCTVSGYKFSDTLLIICCYFLGCMCLFSPEDVKSFLPLRKLPRWINLQEDSYFSSPLSPHSLKCLCLSKSHVSGWIYIFYALRGRVTLSSLLSMCVLSATVWACKASGHVAAVSWSIFTSGLIMSPSMSTHLVMLRTGSVNAPRSTQADCASSTPASATPVVMEPHASQSHHWKPCVSAPMEDKVYCVRNVSVTAPHRCNAV